MAGKGQFTPYTSPATKDGRKRVQGNLTGPVRKLKDLAAELHNAVDRWQCLHTSGHTALSHIVNHKLQYIYQQNDESEASEEGMSAKTLSQKLEPECQALQQIIESMEEVVSKLQSLACTVHSVVSLCAHRGDSEAILFSSWTVHQFADTVEAVHAMYARELRLKKELCQMVAYADSRSALMFCSAAWLHQPYVDSKMLVMAVLQETGHVS